MFLALAHFRSKHPMVPPLSHRVVRKLVLAWKSQFHTFSRTFVVYLPCASCDLYISLLQRHLLECDDHYTLSWNANHIHVQDVSKWLLWGVQVHWRNKPIFHFLYSKSFKANNSCFSLHRNTCQAHSNSHYLKISRIVTPKETCLFSSLSMAGSGSSSRALSKSSFAYHVSRRSLHLLG